MQLDSKSGFRLGPWEARPLDGELDGPDGCVHIEPKVMDVLVVLAQHAGQVVEREALLRQVWGARAAVSDEPLTRCIAQLRRALGDSRHAPSYIQTVPKRGYRLLAPVSALHADAVAAGTAPEFAPDIESPDAVAAGTAPERATDIESPDAVAARTAPERATDVESPGGAAPPADGGLPRRPHRGTRVSFGLTLGLILLAASVGAALILDRRPGEASAPSPPIAGNTLAVLPFVYSGREPDNDYLSEGIADEILSRLNDVPGLRVVARTSSFSFKDSHEDVRSIAAKLRVAYVLEGAIRRSGDRLRIDAQLVKADRGYTIWSARYESVLSKIKNIFGVQDDIANAIVGSLHDAIPIVVSAPTIHTPPPTQSAAAYELLLRGRQYLDRREEEPLRRSIEVFQQAIALDASFGPAYVGLAKAYALLPSYSIERQDEMFALALKTLDTGREHDPSIDASMQGLLALIAYSRWDWIRAQLAFDQALEHSPNDPDVLVWYSQFLGSVGRLADSLRQARRAKEIDPLSPVVNHRLSVALMWMDKDQEALRQSELAAKLGMGASANPDSFVVLRLRFRDYPAVRPILIGVQTMFARPTAWVDPFLDALADRDRLAPAIEAVGKAQRERDIPPKFLFGAWLYLDQPGRALDAALALVHDRPSFNVEFLFSREAKALRAQPRFGELIRATGLDRYWNQFGWPDMCREHGEDIVCE